MSLLVLGYRSNLPQNAVTSLYDFSVDPKDCDDTWLPSSLITAYSLMRCSLWRFSTNR